jgi:hypothetical protein
VKIQTVYNFFIMTMQERKLLSKSYFCIKDNEYIVYSHYYRQTHQSCTSKLARFFFYVNMNKNNFPGNEKLPTFCTGLCIISHRKKM